MGIRGLRLTPLDPEASPSDLAQLADTLQRAGLIASAFDHNGELRYRPDPKFHSLIVFLGSPPIVQLEQQDGVLVPVAIKDSRNECSVWFSEVSEEPRFDGGPPTVPPLCRACGYAVSQWPGLMSEWWEDRLGHRYSCAGCGLKQRVYDLDWQDCAAMGRFYIAIERIRFRQAAPAPELFSILASATGYEWKHYYYDSNPNNEGLPPFDPNDLGLGR
jgi:hypothetical protein